MSASAPGLSSWLDALARIPLESKTFLLAGILPGPPETIYVESPIRAVTKGGYSSAGLTGLPFTS